MSFKNNPSPNKEQVSKPSDKDLFLIKGKTSQHTKHMLAWIELSKD